MFPQYSRLLRSGAARLQSYQSVPRRYYSIGDKLNEKEPGGQRKAIIAVCAAVPVVAYFWLRGGNDTKTGSPNNSRGANQEYQTRAEGNR
ncbi:hypothetical protein ASPWEDRAFT_174343 [Aspergillus wentii DTO 134E9]|uniref:Uncharacterized protein n=1 Tax=Aspergillus wentii DTO 134E9 TaxID=1073089 RepID=A0A1L9RDI8_ASPWE|nr:uncharacterized protein ASPWEDRAFT_174343 [Aspergillus wentii DTO 134E9]KAI9933186.1 hypothetical protein MW887_007657 [Aspergillus wentii]OJJ32913.1 hypothetical protein ASPWEDRAFT_174343 [Aspergillus wentii DTO 134E9]